MRNTRRAGLCAAAAMTLAASPAAHAADPIKVSLGGFVRQYFFVADQTKAAGEDINAAGMFTEARLDVDGRTTLDNGLIVRTYMRFNAETRATANLDEGFLEVISSVGRLRAGEKAGVNTVIMGDPVPQAFLTVYEEVIGDAILARNGVTVRDAFTFRRFTGNALGISYQSPDLAGLRFGVTYHPTTLAWEGPVNNAVMPNNAFDVTAQYQGYFTGGSYRVTGGYFHSNSHTGGIDGVKAWNVAAGLAYGGWELAAAYIDTKPASGLDEQAWTVGMFYGFGPLQFSADYREARRRVAANLPFRESTDRVTLQSAYKLGPGISFGLAGFYAGQTDAAGVDWDGGGVVSGLKVDF